MLILDTVCSDPGIIQFVKILKTIFEMIQIIGPILAVVSLAIIFLKNVSTGDIKNFEKNKNRIKNSLVALVITFFLPIFVNLVMSITFMSNTFEVASCWKKADGYKFSTGSYKAGKNNKKKSETFIIDPSKYTGIDGDPNEGLRNTFGNEVNSASSFSLKDSLASLALAQQNDPSHKGGRKYWKYMGFNGRVAWCACFVSWCVHHAGYNGQKVSSVLNYKSAGVAGWIGYCKSSKKTTYHSGNSYTPQRGDIVFFDWNGGGADHIGIVYKTSSSTVYTIEGNTSDSVHTRQYSKNSRNLYGYCSW